jgi:hypothetical protein
MGEDLAGFAEQVEGHQDEHQHRQHRQRAQHEQPRHVEGDPLRREELRLIIRRHRLAPAAAAEPKDPAEALGELGEDRARAPPIGWPPGLWARVQYIHRIRAANRRKGVHRAITGSIRPCAAICSAYWFTL